MAVTVKLPAKKVGCRLRATDIPVSILSINKLSVRKSPVLEYHLEPRITVDSVFILATFSFPFRFLCLLHVRPYGGLPMAVLLSA